MSSRNVSPNTTPGFSAEMIRAALLEDLAIPKAMLRKALGVTYDKLSAKETKFFTFQGEVVSERVVDAHDIQLRAAALIQDMAGLSVKNASPPAQAVAVEVDPQTGVVRIIMGAAPTASIETFDVPEAQSFPTIEASEVSTTPTSPAEPSPGPPQVHEAVDASEEHYSVGEIPVEFHRRPAGKLPDDIRKTLFGK